MTTDPFVTVERLSADPEIVLADCRWYLDGRSAAAAYRGGHIPGARFVDLDVDLSAPPGPRGRHPLPDPDHFGAAMRRIGVDADSMVVAYDDTGGYTAGRLWWLLDAIGVESYVLAGGIDAFGGELEIGDDPGPVRPGSLVVDRWPVERFASIDEVQAALDDPSVAIIDARSAERYAGIENTIDPRFGHIPGAVNVPARDNLDGEVPRSASDLQRSYARDGIGPDTEVIAYCGSGVSACLDLLALRRSGHDRARLYVGSWSEWGADPERPLEAGEQAG